jgi:hypothetical protein
LAVDNTLNSQLKAEVRARLDHLALNPLENGAAGEAQLAREQYNALIQYAGAPGGLGAKLERDRRKELASYTQSRTRRVFAAVGRLFSPGPRRDSEMADPVLVAELDSHRRALYHQRFLEQLLASSPRPEVVRNLDEIERSLEALSEAAADPHSPQLIAKVFARSGDSELRVACLRALQRLNVQEARNELLRLAEDPGTGPGWRELCLLYLSNDSAPVLAGGGQ